MDKLKQEHEEEKELFVKKIGELTLDVVLKKQNQMSQMRKKVTNRLGKFKVYNQKTVLTYIKNAIDHIHYEEPSYGVRRIKNELHNLVVGRRIVKR